MIWAALLAAGLGAGLLIVARGLVPAARPLRLLSDELTTPRVRAGAFRPSDAPRARWERLVAKLAGGPSPRLASDLSVLGRSSGRHTLDKLGYAGAFLAMVVVAIALVPLAGVAVPIVPALTGAVGFAAFGWFYPDLEVRSKAAAARRSWAEALTVFVDLVGISLAGGAGVEDALSVAARAGAGPRFAELDDALRTSHTRRQKLWVALDELGERSDIPALRELAAAVDLAAESGSRIRETLLAKAGAMRVRQLTEAEADAQKASETMGVAPALMAVAAVVLIGYPAVARFFE